MNEAHRFRVEDEITGLDCGEDYRSFIFGHDCKRLAIKVIIEGNNFHYAHLCKFHTNFVLRKLEKEYDYTI